MAVEAQRVGLEARPGAIEEEAIAACSYFPGATVEILSAGADPAAEQRVWVRGTKVEVIPVGPVAETDFRVWVPETRLGARGRVGPVSLVVAGCVWACRVGLRSRWLGVGCTN